MLRYSLKRINFTNSERVYLSMKGFNFNEIRRINIDFDKTFNGNTEKERLEYLDKISDAYKLIGSNWKLED